MRENETAGPGRYPRRYLKSAIIPTRIASRSLKKRYVRGRNLLKNSSKNAIRPGYLDLASRALVVYTPDDNANKRMYLNNLGGAYLRRFDRLDRLVDIDEAIAVMRQALELTPDDHAIKPMYVGNLGNSLLRRFEHSNNRRDIDDAVLAMRQAVELSPDAHAHKPRYLSNLGNVLLSRFKYFDDLPDIEEALSALKQAIELTPNGHSYKVTYLSSLGDSFLTRYKRTGDHLRYHCIPDCIPFPDWTSI